MLRIRRANVKRIIPPPFLNPDLNLNLVCDAGVRLRSGLGLRALPAARLAFSACFRHGFQRSDAAPTQSSDLRLRL